jgi:hypothetical protein
MSAYDTETLAEVLAGGVEAANSAFRGARPGSPNDLTRRRIVTALEALAARVEQARVGPKVAAEGVHEYLVGFYCMGEPLPEVASLADVIEVALSEKDFCNCGRVWESHPNPHAITCPCMCAGNPDRLRPRRPPMPDAHDTETLAEVIRSVTDLWDEPLDEVHDIPGIVNAILASNWLAARIEQARAGVECSNCGADDLACTACGALGTLTAQARAGEGALLCSRSTCLDEAGGALGERIVRDIDRRRGEHWQQHLHDHPYADARSCPGCYAAHDAYAAAAKIARAALAATAGDQT